MKSKLILIDGLPGTGKSTTAHFLARQLTKNNFQARWFHEFEDANPLFDSDPIEFKKIDKPKAYINENLKKWQKLVDEVTVIKSIYIIESYLFQCTIGYLFFNDVNPELIWSYAQKIPLIITNLDPVVIYFRPESFEKSLQRLTILRGEEWANRCMETDCELPYATSRNLKGFEGWVQMYSDYLSLTDRIFESYNFKKIKLDNLRNDLDQVKQKLLEFLSLKHIKEEEPPVECLQKFAGIYRFQQSKFYFPIKLEGKSLFLYDYFSYKLRLLSIGRNAFVLETTPHKLFFHEDENGNIFKVTHDGSAIYEAGEYTLIKKQDPSTAREGAIIRYCEDEFDNLIENALVYAYDFRNYQQAIKLFQQAFKIKAGSVRLNYLYACILSLAEKKDLAFEVLEKLLDEIKNPKRFLEIFSSDQDFANIKNDNCWSSFISKLESLAKP